MFNETGSGVVRQETHRTRLPYMYRFTDSPTTNLFATDLAAHVALLAYGGLVAHGTLVEVCGVYRLD